ncbi:MAG: DUF4157 domain-containing protein [Cyanobacteria bacterium J06638_20]
MSQRSFLPASSQLGLTPIPTGLFQRHQCAACECRTQRDALYREYRTESSLHRQAAKGVEVGEVPKIVDAVLNSSGESLSSTTRHLMESRFQQDFSQVRVHTDAQAAESARAVNALAYTVGRDLVFASGQYNPTTQAGQALLAHELSHVVQQGNRTTDTRALQIQPGRAMAEAEADRAAHQVMAAQPLHLSSGTEAQLMRRLAVEHPTRNIPNPDGNGLVQTNAETIEQYLRHLSAEGRPVVAPTSGDVSMSNPEFCQSRGFWNRLGRGISSGFVRGAEIGAYFLGVGAVPGSIFGALIGGIAGIWGPDSQAEESSTPTGSTCICDFINSPNPWTVRIDDTDTPLYQFAKNPLQIIF